MKNKVYRTDSSPLLEGEIHIWQVTLNFTEPEFKNFLKLLSPDENQRANRFKFAIHRQRFIASRGILRIILGNYLQIAPEKIKFRYTSHGKPYLDLDTDLFFNASDSQDLAVYALTLNREVGIDIEYMKSMEYEAIAKRFFSPKEVQVFESLPEDQKRQAFFNCWTRKEAFIKAIGEGLSFPLSDFAVSFAPNDSVKLLEIRGDQEAAKDWSIRSLTPASNFAAAIVTKGKISQLQYWQLSLEE